MYNINDLELLLVSELREIAEKLAVKNSKKLGKEELIYKILDIQSVTPDQELLKLPPIPVAQVAEATLVEETVVELPVAAVKREPVIKTV